MAKNSKISVLSQEEEEEQQQQSHHVMTCVAAGKNIFGIFKNFSGLQMNWGKKNVFHDEMVKFTPNYTPNDPSRGSVGGSGGRGTKGERGAHVRRILYL